MKPRDLLFGLLLLPASAEAGPLALDAAWEQAVEPKRPLLVLVRTDDVIPGFPITVWLQNAKDPTLAALSGVDPVCAERWDLDPRLPATLDTQGTWFVLVRLDLPTPTFRTITVPERDGPRDLAWLRDLSRDFDTQLLGTLRDEGLVRSGGNVLGDSLYRGRYLALWSHE